MHERRRLILASSSPYRKQLLERLHLPFETCSPEVNESPLPGESPQALACRLAETKARKVAESAPDALIIGSDQVAVLEGLIVGKPGTEERAEAQLLQARGKTLEFLTGVCLLDSATGRVQTDCVSYRVRLRPLEPADIRRYIRLEMPLNCAGALKSEGLGAALIERMEGDDPTALIGLPLLRLVQMLEGCGYHVLQQAVG